MSKGLLRLRITEIYQEHSGPHEKARVTYDELVLEMDTMEAAEHARWIQPGDSYLNKVVSSSELDNYMGLQYGDEEGKTGMFLLMRIDSFAAYLYREDDFGAGPITTFGEKQMTHFEIRRTKTDEDVSISAEDELSEDEKEEDEGKPEKEIVGYWEDGLAIYSDGTREERKVEEEDHRKLTELDLDREGLWEENFGSHKDSKPYGPMSVGADISFPGSSFVYGLPEHASATPLKTTIGEGAGYEHPYRLYNLDVFEYDLDVPMALYGAVPLVVSQSTKTGTNGVFWFNPTETFVDIFETEDGSKSTHWMSESGIIDLFFVPGPDPKSLYHHYSLLTGVVPQPPMFSLGYHQCRWNCKWGFLILVFADQTSYSCSLSFVPPLLQTKTSKMSIKYTESSKNSTTHTMYCGSISNTRMENDTLLGTNTSSLIQRKCKRGCGHKVVEWSPLWIHM